MAGPRFSPNAAFNRPQAEIRAIEDDASGARPSTFRQRDVTRAVKAVTKTVSIRRVEIDRAGNIAIITGSETAPQGETSSPLDQWLAKHAHQAEGH